MNNLFWFGFNMFLLGANIIVNIDGIVDSGFHWIYLISLTSSIIGSYIFYKLMKKEKSSKSEAGK